jgi:uncharacterized protein (DUF885 family)
MLAFKGKLTNAEVIMKYIATGLILLSLSSCSLFQQKDFTLKEKEKHTKEINSFFEEVYEEKLALSPEGQTYRGRKTNYDKLNDISDQMSQRKHQLNKTHLGKLKNFNKYALMPQAKLSYRLLKRDLKQAIKSFKYRFHYYPINQMFGRHSSLPAFMINMHRIENVQDADDYIARLNEFENQFDVLIKLLETRKERGIMAPKFVYPKAISDAQNIVSGAPFDKSNQESPLFKDFRQKVQELDIKASTAQKLVARMEHALMTSVGPAYWKLIKKLEALEKEAPNEGSVANLPEGRDYYKMRLRHMTTTNMSADEIHQLGLEQTSRVHAEMKKIMREVDFNGSLEDFFKYMKNSKKFRYEDSEKGRKNYLSDTRKIIKNAWAKLPDMFGILPKAQLTVKAVEPFRERSAGLAFYQGPSENGERPGIYYVNLNDIQAVNKYEQKALAYHEAVPGHHMQIAISTELEQLPKFRRYGHYTAYIEGWALYAERLASEFGLYNDPYAEFGRLSMELLRAGRLVVDTGLHDKEWSMEYATQWLNKNTPNSASENKKAIQRYVVMPGQATAYMIGMLKILNLREMAKKELGEDFSIKAFHDQILKDGAMPLIILEEKITSWASRTLP